MRRAISAAVVSVAFVAVLASCDSTVSGGAVTAVKMARSDGVVGMTVSKTDWTDVPGASVNIDVPSGEQAIVLARWAAVSNNQPGSNLSSIIYRVLVGSQVASPGGPGSGAYFVSVLGYVERSSQVLPSGTYTVKLQARADQGPDETATVNLSPFHFTVERIGA